MLARIKAILRRVTPPPISTRNKVLDCRGIRMERFISRGRNLGYWESGMDIGYSRDWFDSFIRHQTEIHRVFKQLQRESGFGIVNGNRTRRTVTRELQTRIEPFVEPTEEKTG